MNLRFLSQSNRETLPSPYIAYDEFTEERIEETLENAINEVEKTPSFSRRKRIGMEMQKRADPLTEVGTKDLRENMKDILLTTTAITGATYALTSGTELAIPLTGGMANAGIFAGGGVAEFQPDDKLLNWAGEIVENNSGDVQVKSEDVQKVKDILSDPEDRPNNAYGVDHGDFIEVHDRKGVEEVIDSYADMYPEAEWVVQRDIDNPFQVIGMSFNLYEDFAIEKDDDYATDQERYELRQSIAQETAEDFCSISTDEILETDSGVAHTPESNYMLDLIIVDINPDYTFDMQDNPEENFIDYSENFQSNKETSKQVEMR